MTVPRSASPLTVFNQISLPIQLNPSTQPVTNLKPIHGTTPETAGMHASTSAPVAMPMITLRFNPNRPMRRGYKGPHRMTAIRLADVTAPIARAELPTRLKAIAMSGGWKPKINPTPRLEERIAASVRRREAPLKCPLPERARSPAPRERAVVSRQPAGLTP